MTHIWVAYFAGAGGILILKFLRVWCLSRHSSPVETLESVLFRWIMQNDAQQTGSWVTTIGVVWMLGYFYISDPATFGLPSHASIAFTLGTIMELVAPAVAGKLVQLVADAFNARMLRP